MTKDNLDEYWTILEAAARKREQAEQEFRRARESIVSRLCECYRDGEDWEKRATYCDLRSLNKCPYFLESEKRKI